jgi:hypothetical protein
MHSIEYKKKSTFLALFATCLSESQQKSTF